MVIHMDTKKLKTKKEKKKKGKLLRYVSELFHCEMIRHPLITQKDIQIWCQFKWYAIIDMGKVPYFPSYFMQVLSVS